MYRNLAFASAAIVTGAIAYASLIEPRTIMRREFDLLVPTLPATLDGISVAFVSDLHLGGPGDPLGSVHRALDVLRDSRPDIILLGGDYYDRGMRVPAEPDWTRFPAIAPTLAIPGNHDYYRDQSTTDDIMRVLADSGIEVLRNRSCDVMLENGPVRIIGLDDPYTGRGDFEQAIRSASAEICPTVMLAHAGLIADTLPLASADLILSGHTHGAQISFSPFRHTGPLDVFWWLDYIKSAPLSPYRQGLFRVRGSLLYVGNGLGTTSLGMRFMAPPEVALFRLWSGAGNPDISCDHPDHYVRDYRTSLVKPALF